MKLLYISLLILSWSILAADNEYQLGPGDEVEIWVYQEPELKTLSKISQSGQIDLPLIGQIKLEGLTVTQAKLSIESTYKQGYLVNPNVTITVRVYRPFFIHGEVKTPGSYKYQADLNIEQAIALAGGLKDRASSSKWIIWRGYPRESFTAVKDTTIMPGDVIKIEKSFF